MWRSRVEFRLLRQQFLIISQLVDAHGRQLFVQLQLCLRQLSQIDHHQEILEKKDSVLKAKVMTDCITSNI